MSAYGVGRKIVLVTVPVIMVFGLGMMVYAFTMAGLAAKKRR